MPWCWNNARLRGTKEMEKKKKYAEIHLTHIQFFSFDFNFFIL